jgi:DNA-binding CsgD family transcriptional regulator
MSPVLIYNLANILLHRHKSKILFMNAQLDLPDREFSEASKHWNLKSILDEIAAKGESLTPREEKMLRGLLCEYSPKEIAAIGFNKTDSHTIRADLSKIYEYIEILLETPLQVGSHNIRRLLKEAGYRL